MVHGRQRGSRVYPGRSREEQGAGYCAGTMVLPVVYRPCSSPLLRVLARVASTSLSSQACQPVYFRRLLRGMSAQSLLFRLFKAEPYSGCSSGASARLRIRSLSGSFRGSLLAPAVCAESPLLVSLLRVADVRRLRCRPDTCPAATSCSKATRSHVVRLPSDLSSDERSSSGKPAGS